MIYKDYRLFSNGIIITEPILVTLKIEYRLSPFWGGRLGAAYAASQTSWLHMKRHNNAESPIFVLLCVLCSKRQPFRFSFSFTAAGVKWHVAALKRLPVLHHSADYICISFWIIGPIRLLWKSNTGASGMEACTASQATLLHMKKLLTKPRVIVLFMCSLFPKATF